MRNQYVRGYKTKLTIVDSTSELFNLILRLPLAVNLSTLQMMKMLISFCSTSKPRIKQNILSTAHCSQRLLMLDFIVLYEGKCVKPFDCRVKSNILKQYVFINSSQY